MRPIFLSLSALFLPLFLLLGDVGRRGTLLLEQLHFKLQQLQQPDDCHPTPIHNTIRNDPAPLDAVRDLEVPLVTMAGPPRPGKRVRQVLPDYERVGGLCTQIYHLLYLPTDWTNSRVLTNATSVSNPTEGKSRQDASIPKESKYPIVVEFAGNHFHSSPGTVEGSSLGYGLTGGTGSIWLSLPYVDTVNRNNAVRWWGNVTATLDYAQQAVATVCELYGGDCSKVLYAGFSRGSIGCNYLGLHTAQIAPLWKAFWCHSHYDGTPQWNSTFPGGPARLARLGHRPQFISQEHSIVDIKEFLEEHDPAGIFTFQALQPGFSHTDQWVLYNVSERRTLRQWYDRVMATNHNTSTAPRHFRKPSRSPKQK